MRVIYYNWLIISYDAQIAKQLHNSHASLKRRFLPKYADLSSLKYARKICEICC